MTQLWSSEDEESLVWESSIWPGRLAIEDSVVSEAVANAPRADSVSLVGEVPLSAIVSPSLVDIIDSSRSISISSRVGAVSSIDSTTEFSSSEESAAAVTTSVLMLQTDSFTSTGEETVLSLAASESPDIDSVSSIEENALSSAASSDLVETIDSSLLSVVALESEAVSSIDRTAEFSSSEETAPTVTVPSSTLQTDVFTSTDEETILSLSAGKTERTLSSSESNELLSIRSATSSVSLFAPGPNVETVAVSDEKGISPTISSIEGSLEISSSIDDSLSTETLVSPFESFEVRSVIERDVINPSISTSSSSSRNLLFLDFDFLVDVNPALLVSEDRETISSEDVTEIEDETNLAILEPSQNEVILE